MGQILHGCARTTAALRRTIQDSQETVSYTHLTLPTTPYV